MPVQEESIAEVVGLRLEKIELVGFVRLHFGPSADVQLSIESPFEIVDAHGTTKVSFSPATGAPPQGLDALGSLFGETVSDALMARDGSLRFSFSTGAILTLPVDQNYEAGHLASPEQYLVVPPGGR